MCSCSSMLTPSPLSHGRYTVPLGLAILMLVIILTGPSRMGLIPFLPLLLSVMGFVTVTLSALAEQHLEVAEDGQSDASSLSGCADSMLFGFANGVSPRYGSPSSSHPTSEFGLSDIQPRVRLTWDPPTQGFFTNGGYVPTDRGPLSPAPEVNGDVPDADSEASHTDIESTWPLLGKS